LTLSIGYGGGAEPALQRRSRRYWSRDTVPIRRLQTVIDSNYQNETSTVSPLNNQNNIARF
jgi:hypothetical protein